MTPEDYIQAVLLTESSDTYAIQERLRKYPRLLHALIGINTENGELQDQLKKVIYYGRALDLINMKEELGDLLWYVALAMDELGFSFEEVFDRNIEKLKVRYGHKFTEAMANSRNLDKERATFDESRDDIRYSDEG